MLKVGPTEWYETIRFSDDVTLIHEPWIKPFYRCKSGTYVAGIVTCCLIQALDISAYGSMCHSCPKEW
jgi:hypothetical protein